MALHVSWLFQHCHLAFIAIYSDLALPCIFCFLDVNASKIPLSHLHFAVDSCNSFVVNNNLTFICKLHCISAGISIQCCVRHNHPKWIYMQINFNKTYSVLFLQLGIPLIFVPSISQPSVSTHQQYPVEGWHCTSSKLPSSLHCGIYRPGIGVPENMS